MKLTLKNIKDSSIPRTLGFTSTDARVVQYVNDAVERLMDLGDWLGTVGRYRFCVQASCLTLPRQIETIRAYSVCGIPGTIQNSWYEFVDNGPGQVAYDDNWDHRLVPRGRACAFDDIIGSHKTIRVYCDRTEDADAQILLQGYESLVDASGATVSNWIDSIVDGVRVNGEYVNLKPTAPATYTQSTKTWIQGGLVAVQKPVTVGVVRLFEYDTSLGTLKPLAYYEPDETIPEYTRVMIPNMENMSCTTTSAVACASRTLEVVAKLKFIPVVNDEDFLLIGNQAAIKLACMAIQDEEADKISSAMAKWALAEKALNKQLGNAHDGETTTIKAAPSDIWGGAVESAL